MATIDTMLRTNVVNKYLAIRGIESLVGGKILETSSKNTTKARRIEMPSVIFSEHSAGKKKTIIDSVDIKTVGIIKMTV